MIKIILFSEKYKKPRRPCPYCGQLQTKLSRHLMRQHKNETEVIEAMKQPSKERDRLFENLKKYGILKSNAKNKSIVMRERAQGSHEVVMCAGCKGFYSSRRIHEHKKKCTTEHALSTGVVKFYPTVPNVSKEIKSNILDRFRNDDVGNLCRADKAIVLMGTKLWSKSSKKERKVIMSDLRVLGNLILKTRQRTKNPTFSGEDVIKRSNFNEISQTIIEMSTNTDGTLKAGLKLSLGYILKKMIKVLKGEYVMNNEMEKAKEVDLFKDVLDYNWDFLFFSAQVSCEAKRTNLRKPKDMPLESDVKKLREFILKEMTHITDDVYAQFDSHLFVRLRNLIVARLTLFNARRGGEPARMLLKDWLDAESNVWVDPQLVENITDPLEKKLLEKYKLAYQSGKGSKRLVPVLIANDTVQPLRRLIKERSTVDILDDNPFLFPNTGSSKDHVSGYIAVQTVTKMINDLEKPQLLIADKFRHRASTLFALLDVSQSEREVFYRHMGHSENINKNIYQCPLALREITEVGNFFDQIDCSTSSNLKDNCSEEIATQEEQEGVLRDERMLSTLEPSTSQEGVIAGEKSLSTLKQGTSQVWARAGEKHSSTVEPSTTTNTQPTSQNQTKAGRRYMSWSLEDTRKVISYFRHFVEDMAVSGTRGSLPSKREVLLFLQQKKIFEGKDVSECTLVNLVKTKIFNERNKYRKERAFVSI